MSQADDHQTTSQTKHCIKCQLMHGNPQFQNMCSVCYNEKNIQTTKQPMTPIKRIEIAKRQLELLQSPRKIKDQEDSAQSEDSQEEESCEGDAQGNVQEDEASQVELDCVKQEECSQQQGQEEGQNNSNQQNEAETTQANINHQNIQCRFDKIKSNPQLSTISKTKPVLIIKQGVQIKIQQFDEPRLKRNFSRFLDQRQDFSLSRGKCKSCNKKTGLLGINCRHCGHEYCNNHRLPQNHKCDVDFIGQYREKKRQQMVEVMPKHKGKIRQI